MWLRFGYDRKARGSELWIDKIDTRDIKGGFKVDRSLVGPFSEGEIEIYVVLKNIIYSPQPSIRLDTEENIDFSKETVFSLRNLLNDYYDSEGEDED